MPHYYISVQQQSMPMKIISPRIVLIALCVVVNACVSSALAAVIPIFLVSNLHVSYFRASLLMVVGTLLSAAATYSLGRIGDAARARYPIAIASAICGLAGAMILAFATSYVAFLLVFASLFAVAGSLFSQLMALAILHARSSSAIIRAVASGGWVIGPPLGGMVATWRSPAVLFLTIAAAYALLAMIIGVMALRLPSPAANTSESKSALSASNRRPASIVLTTCALASLHFLLSVCALGIPWRIVQIGGSEYHVGLAFAIAAAVEIPLIACSNIIVSRAGQATMLVVSSTLLLVYFAAASLIDSVPAMVSLSVINGVVTGIMMGLSLIVLQERLPDRPAHASAIYSNTIRLSYVAALLTAGGIAQQISVVAIFQAAGALALCLSLYLIPWQPLGRPVLRWRGSRLNAS
ncbi:MFS transporter [Mesorhizobium sp. B2-5-9]|uniref:MFS transporter n=2 Tax=unclassified Mesorhizobium TaxID=325217 RepID=UPI0015E465F0|nr:MFS transporter [Mesorhizobium sp. B2-5-9]